MMLDVAEAVGVGPDRSAIVQNRDLRSSDVVTGELSVGDRFSLAGGQRGTVETIKSLR
jgi:hypothetical protein